MSSGVNGDIIQIRNLFKTYRVGNAGLNLGLILKF